MRQFFCFLVLILEQNISERMILYRRDILCIIMYNKMFLRVGFRKIYLHLLSTLDSIYADLSVFVKCIWCHNFMTWSCCKIAYNQ